MGELQEHLQHRPSATLGTHDLNEILLSVYVALRAAVRDGCDLLVCTPLRLEWSRAGHTVDRLSLGRVKPTMDFRQALSIVLEGDAIVRRHLHPVSEGPDEAIYRIAYNTGRLSA